jgi:serine/threonine protein kinase
VPHADLVATSGDARAYLTEARTVANLDHPHIVPVYDVGGTQQFPCYVVSKYIDGTDLSRRLKQSRLPMREAVEMVAAVAEALHYAHLKGLVHRDIKPGNIVIDAGGKPYVTDFGLALKEKEFGTGPRSPGTLPYMSPEQASGRGHLVDGRSDIFSLGVVLYELLGGRRPFRAESSDALLEQIIAVGAQPLQQIDDKIPKELDGVCLKALSKRPRERYPTAADMAKDLRQFLAAAVPPGGLHPNGMMPPRRLSIVAQFGLGLVLLATMLSLVLLLFKIDTGSNASTQPNAGTLSSPASTTARIDGP